LADAHAGAPSAEPSQPTSDSAESSYPGAYSTPSAYTDYNSEETSSQPAAEADSGSGGSSGGGSDSGSEGEEEDGGGPVKSFFEHLEDLRWVLVKSAVVIGISVMLCLIAGNWLVAVIKWPLRMTNMPKPTVAQTVSFGIGTNFIGSFYLTNNQWGPLDLGTNGDVVFELAPVLVGTNQVLAFQRVEGRGGRQRTLEESIQLLNLNPAGGFFVAFQVAIYGGLLLAAPFVLYFLADFIFPALRRIEKRYVKRGFVLGLFLFMLGVLFCYFVLMPLALRASVSYSEWLGFAANQWRAEEYISFVCKFMLGMGLGFELPIIVLTLVKIGLLSYSQLAAFRKYMLVINLMLGAVLTTPEVLTQVMMALPLQVLYEISVWIAYYWERQDRKRASLES
jgi:sec-independent protein translocase protein TatC